MCLFLRISLIHKVTYSTFLPGWSSQPWSAMIKDVFYYQYSIQRHISSINKAIKRNRSHPSSGPVEMVFMLSAFRFLRFYLSFPDPPPRLICALFFSFFLLWPLLFAFTSWASLNLIWFVSSHPPKKSRVLPPPRLS